jgi:hypothetical protein
MQRVACDLQHSAEGRTIRHLLDEEKVNYLNVRGAVSGPTDRKAASFSLRHSISAE